MFFPEGKESETSMAEEPNPTSYYLASSFLPFSCALLDRCHASKNTRDAGTTWLFSPLPFFFARCLREF